MVAWLLLVLSFALCVPLVLGADLPINSTMGGTAILHCPGRPLKDTETLLWVFDGSHSFSYKNGTWCVPAHYVNRTWLGSIQQNNFSLVITNISKEDAGHYTCRISEDTEDIQSIRLFVNDAKTHREQRAAGTQHGGSADAVCRPYREREDPPGASSGGSQGLTVAIVVPVVLLVLVVVVVLIIQRRNRQGAERQEDSKCWFRNKMGCREG